ncbi:MAG: glycerol-3-phosphate 1-O-acyltransferase PlsY [Desulfobulbaceae bacterium]|nr:glycerol-3-phosphate 1-O-acyltransferase PlsY [Desulfobulbaceae bacterium]
MSAFGIILILISYLIGAIPFGLLLSMGSGVDIRSAGSRNIGATNVGRLLGKKLGIMTLLADIAKGFLPMYIAGHLLSDIPDRNIMIGLCGAATVMGHMFPVYLGFKGGKGVATGLGVFLYLAPSAVLFCIAVFAATLAASGFVSLASLLGSLSVLPVLWYLQEADWKNILAFFVVLMIWIKHYQNIGRLLNGTEKSWRKKE